MGDQQEEGGNVAEWAKHLMVTSVWTYKCEDCGVTFDSGRRLHIGKCISCRVKTIDKIKHDYQCTQETRREG